jgi:hypothetical protein
MFDVREIRAIAAAAAVLGIYTVVVLSTGRINTGEFAQLFADYLTGSALLWLVVGVIFGFFHLYRGARASGKQAFLVPLVRDALRDRWQRDYTLSLLWPPILFALLMASFNAFKQMVLPLAGYRLDPFLAGADRALFFGHDPWRVTHALFGSPDATLLIDHFYNGWCAPMAVGIMVCAFVPASTFRLRTQYLLSYLAIWIGIGSVLAFLLPSAGPCFYSRVVGPSPSYDALLASLAQVQAVTGSPVNSLAIQQWLMHAHGSHSLVLGAGISAMPSVHNALALLFALAAFRINRAAGWLFAAYAFVIWVGSIHLGWHYAVDGIVGDALTLGIWVVSGRLAERLERPIFASAAKPALA